MTKQPQSSEQRLALAVNEAIDAWSSAFNRHVTAGISGAGLDAKRERAWCEYGFPSTVDFNMLYQLYRRGGVAYGAVEKLKGGCWKTNPEVIEGQPEDENRDQTDWEKSVEKVLTARFWRNFAKGDAYRLVGRFSGLLLHIADNREWNQPVERANSKLVKITPVWANSIAASEIVTDTTRADYGMPSKWQYTEQIGTTTRKVDIHPDRIFILGDWSNGAIGFLEPAYNAFVSLEKVEGGSGESFLKNASRQISMNFDKEVNLADIAQTYGVSVADLQKKFNGAARALNQGIDQMIVTQGASLKSLSDAVSDPTPTYNINLQTASAALDIPTKILVGMQTGERASTEDQKYFNGRCQERRLDLSFDIEDLVRHLMRVKIITQMEDISVIWDDLNEQTSSEKLSSAKDMMDINDKAIGSSMEAVFSRKEVRVAAGYEPDDIDENENDPLPERVSVEVEEGQ